MIYRLDYGSGAAPREGFLSSDFCGGPYYDYLIQDYKVLDAPASTFHEINCRNVLHHIPKDDLPKVIDEFRRLLVPGGHLIISEPRQEFHKQNLILDIIWYRFLRKEMNIALPVEYVDYKQYLHGFDVLHQWDHFNNEVIIFEKTLH